MSRPLAPGRTAVEARKKRAPPARPVWAHPVREVAAPLPALLWVVLCATLVSCVLSEVNVLGFSLKGWMWIVPSVCALLEILRRRVPRGFPILLWAPWGLYAAVSLGFSPFENALQRTTMMLAPILMGYACSGLAIGPETVRGLLRQLRRFAWLLLLLLLVPSGILTTLELPEVTGLAPQVITGSLLSVYFAAAYAYGFPGSLAAWIAMACFPVVAVTRTAAVVTAGTLVGTFAPLPLLRRAVVGAIVLVAALAVFQSERMQRKMFYSGAGGISDLSTQNPDFRSTGRFALWEAMKTQISRKPLFGHGANAQEDFILSQIGFRGQPHNDWLRLAFDYGWVGAGLYGATLLVQSLLLLHRAYLGEPRGPETLVLLTAGAGSFAVYAAIMFTDNILIYPSYFGMLQFALVGAAYGVCPQRPKGASA